MNDKILFYLAIAVLIMLVFNKVVIENFGETTTTTTTMPSLADITNAFANLSSGVVSTITSGSSSVVSVTCNENSQCPSNMQCRNGICA